MLVVWFCIFASIVATNALNLYCSLDKAQWKFVAEKVRCNVQKAYFNESKHDEKLYNVFTEGSHSLSEVEIIEIAEKSFPYIPRNWKQHFGDRIIGLKIVNSELETVSALNLKDFPKLMFLELKGNPLIVVPEDLFLHTPNIQYFGVADNEIRVVGKGAFNKTLKLEEIDFSNNFCLDAKADNREATLELVKTFVTSCRPDGVPVMSWVEWKDYHLQILFSLIFLAAVLGTYVAFLIMETFIKSRTYGRM